MSSQFDLEAARVLNDPDLKDDAVCTIFDTAIVQEDLQCLVRITNTYTRNYLDFVLGGYPEYLDEAIEKGEM